MTATTVEDTDKGLSKDLKIAISGLGITQIIAWGSIYYALAVVGPSITKDFGWSAQWTYVGFSAALVVAGLCSPISGRMVDRHGGRLVMSIGSAVAAIGLAALALSQSWTSYLAAWMVLGLAKSMVLYEPAFATLAQISIVHARRAIIYLSFFGGLASTFSWPITRLLHDALGWRETFFIYAGLAALVCLPIHWFALPNRVGSIRSANPATDAGTPPTPKLSASFTILSPILLSASFAMTAFMWSGISVHLLSMLQLLGFAASASVLIGSMIGPSQVLGRVGDMIFGSRVHPLTVLQFSSTVLPIAFAVLFLGQGSTLAAGVFAIGYGLSIGMNTIARGAVPLALFGPEGYGARLGRIAAPSFVAEAAAPIVYAAAIDRSGVWGGLVLAASAASIAWVGVLGLSILHRREAKQQA